MSTKVEDAIAAWRSVEGRAFQNQLREVGLPWLIRRTVAIYALADGGIPVLHGSGVLLRIAEHSFLLSAGHVLVAARADDTVLLVSPGVPGTGFIPLHGVTVQHTENKGDIDIGVVLLPAEIHEELAAHKDFLRLSELDLRDGPEPEGWFAVLGFPRELTSTEYNDSGIALKSDVFYYSTVRYREALDEYTPGFSFAVSFPPDNNVNSAGEPSRMPAPNGISGCGIWCMHYGRTRREEWTLGDVRLVAIEHSVVPRKAIKGVRVRHVVTCIGDAYPELRPAICLSMSGS